MGCGSDLNIRVACLWSARSCAKLPGQKGVVPDALPRMLCQDGRMSPVLEDILGTLFMCVQGEGSALLGIWLQGANACPGRNWADGAGVALVPSSSDCCRWGKRWHQNEKVTSTLCLTGQGVLRARHRDAETLLGRDTLALVLLGMMPVTVRAQHSKTEFRLVLGCRLSHWGFQCPSPPQMHRIILQP